MSFADPFEPPDPGEGCVDPDLYEDDEPPYFGEDEARPPPPPPAKQEVPREADPDEIPF